MVLRPIYNKVLVQIEKETPAEGLIMDPNLQEAVKGKIISVGIKPPSHKTASEMSAGESSPDFLYPNEIIYFFIRDAKKFKIDGQEYYLLDEEDILVVKR